MDITLHRIFDCSKILVVVILLLRGGFVFAACAAPPPGDIPYTALGVACGPAQLDSATTLSPSSVITNGATAARTLATRTGDRLNILDYMPAAATQPVNLAVEVQTKITIAAGSTTLTIPFPVFSPTTAIIGDPIFIQGAGASGSTLSTTIATYVNPYSVTLSSAASTALSSASGTLLFGPDATATMTAAINAANAKMASGNMACIYLPSGQYIVSGTLPVFATGRPGCVMGEGPSKSFINLAPAFAGDLFAWSEAWVISGDASGARVADLRINGWSTAAAQQNALMFYDRNDNVSLENVDVWNLPGRALASGLVKNTPASAYMRESQMRGLRFFYDGVAPQGGGTSCIPTTPGVPVVEFNTNNGGPGGTDDGTNAINVMQMDIYAPKGPGLVLRAAYGSVRALNFDQLRIEGAEDPGAILSAGDLIQIGDPSTNGRVTNIRFTSTTLGDPYVGCAAIRTTAPSSALKPYMINFEGAIGGGLPNGQGIRVDAGRLMKFVVPATYTIGPNVVIGMTAGSITTPAATNMVTCCIVIESNGDEASMTYAVAPVDISTLKIPVMRTGLPNATGATGGQVAIAGTMGGDAIKSSVVTVSALGTCNAAGEGTRLSVSDASAPAFNTALVGGGSVHVGARCNGSAWVAE